ncbi:MAG: hypothetical protein JNG88_05315 [Phycisphaerales bacterium]|nr:hypothetical protein [Phycisphaerales bacterium]
MSNTEHLAAANQYLKSELGQHAPAELRFERVFDEQPLEGEGPVSLFSFELALGGGNAQCPVEVRRHYVVAGQTRSNYFPAYSFDADDAYSFHIGTLFMVAMPVSRIDDADEPPGARESLKNLTRAYSAAATIGAPELAALFRCDDAVFAVYRVPVDGRMVYGMGADCPPGFYELTDHPPQTALRLHLGKVIREEARSGL